MPQVPEDDGSIPPGGAKAYGLRGDRFRQIALTTIARMNMAGLRPDHAVLDIGCGPGRIARYLTQYLGENGTYEGFDVLEWPVRWCEANITPLFPHFRFQSTPLFNGAYSADPTLPSAAEFAFPFPDESFDFAFANSVFNHMLPDATANYFHEIQRVLRPGGISFTTWFFFSEDPEAYSHTHVKRGMQADEGGTFAVSMFTSKPAITVAYTEATVRAVHALNGLTVVEPLHPGYNDLTDVVVARK